MPLMSDPTDIAVWRRLDDRITTSGQPTEAQIAELAAIGVAHVINIALHTHEQALPDETATVTAAGMRYTHIPVPFDAPTDDHFAAFCAAMDETPDAKVHVHCIVNARVSAFLYRWRRDVIDMDEAEARTAMETVWRPGGVWGAFIGDAEAAARSHLGPRPAA
ncbi:hypothetical protein EOD43_13065 [Sphingomonas crocodyli]|uniref:DSP-PTPase phosphatase fused to NAD+ Kinase domain-containing protein n=2 Tax=Sphingomonas crocodyli TaxID=1979270 RepID=A0A437MAS3_9SPHN|nr:hypothetical protein EOD43_13065 [Sphingomonas crocodyli]